MKTIIWFGLNGPAVLFFGSLLGLLIPNAAEFVHPHMALGVWMFTFGAFAKANMGEFKKSARHPFSLALSLGGAVVLAPLAAYALSKFLGFSTELSAGLALAAAAPPSGAAVVAMLGLDVSLAVFSMIVTVCLAPLTFAWLSQAFGANVEVDSLSLAC